MYTVEENKDFAARHGGNELYVDGRLLFPDGASMDATGMMRFEPPTDPVGVLKAKRAYLVAKLEKLNDARNKFKQECIQQATLHAKGCAPPPVKNWKEQLDEGAKGIAVIAGEIVLIERKLKEFPEAVNPGVVFAERQQNTVREMQDLVAAIHSA